MCVLVLLVILELLLNQQDYLPIGLNAVILTRNVILSVRVNPNSSRMNIFAQILQNVKLVSHVSSNLCVDFFAVS